MNQAILEGRGLERRFHTAGGVVRAVDGVSLRLYAGETVGLVGESGCGKSTLGRLLLHLLEPTAGHVLLGGQPLSATGLRTFRRQVQIVFQDPFRALNPRRTVGQALAEPLIIHRLAKGPAVRERVAQLLAEVGLDPAAAHLYPHQFSGGQRQRIGIARALAVNPRVVVLDEPVSALDVSVQAQIIELLARLQREHNLAYLFISHNLAVVRHVATRVAVMYLGRLVEESPVKELYAASAHPYTRALLQAVPEPVPGAGLTALLAGDPPDPAAHPPGCRFHPRCPLRRHLGEPPECETVDPPMLEAGPGHTSACHFWSRVAEIS